MIIKKTRRVLFYYHEVRGFEPRFAPSEARSRRSEAKPSSSFSNIIYPGAIGKFALKES
jgi:hypothetical protein